jgi:uncharacterized RDD family membrane protein YckC
MATTEMNPYDPPEASINPYRAPFGGDDRQERYEIASNWLRFATFIIDNVAILVCAFCLGVFVALVLGEEGVERLENIPDFLLGFAIMTFFYCFFEGIWGRTPGKLICGTKVVSEDGGPPSFGQILGRSLCRFIPFEPLSFFTDRGWHDSISKTFVIRVR